MTIDLTHVDTKAAFHHLMKRELHFPDWYGGNWDAFWDAINAVVELPECVVFSTGSGSPRPAPAMGGFCAKSSPTTTETSPASKSF